MTADSSNFFFECVLSNSKAKIPHATVGRAAPVTNRRRESFTPSLTCATRTASLLVAAAAINTTHKTRPKAFRNIRALINRCPTAEPLYDGDGPSQRRFVQRFALRRFLDFLEKALREATVL